jgi:hypothetical protein
MSSTADSSAVRKAGKLLVQVHSLTKHDYVAVT